MSNKLTLNGAGAVVECMKQESVKFVFGVPGGQVLSIMDSLYDTPGIRFITTHHEGAAACMADGYARTTGKIGVCIATTGPGTTNLLTGIGGALRDSSPVLVLTGNNRREHLNRDDNQEADHIALLRGLTKWNFLVTHAEQIPWAMREAFRRALTGCPGPVHLDFSRDTLEDGTVEYTPVDPAGYRTDSRPNADPKSIDIALEYLSEAQSPVIWIGRGVSIADAGAEVLNLAETLNIPVITTYNGIGSVPTTHPCVFGSRFRHGSRLTAGIIRDADLLFLVGNSMNATSTSRWKEQLPGKIVQVDIDPNMIGRHYPVALGINADAKRAMAQLSSVAVTSPIPQKLAKARQKRLTDLQGTKKQWRSEVMQVQEAGRSLINPRFLMKTMREVLPDDTQIVAGAGNPGIWSNLLEIREPGSYMKPVGFGNMGFALPAAVAVKLAHPNKLVACIIGDGSLGMCISEIETAVREKAPVIIVVMNNLSYGNIKQEQFMHYGPRYIGVDFTDIDYSRIAEGFGAKGHRVTDPSELSRALQTAVASQSTYLLDVRIDPDENVWNDPF